MRKLSLSEFQEKVTDIIQEVAADGGFFEIVTDKDSSVILIGKEDWQLIHDIMEPLFRNADRITIPEPVIPHK